MSFFTKLYDKWRGYTDADVDSLQTKWRDAQSQPAGTLVHLTGPEYKAMSSGEDVWGKTTRPVQTITLYDQTVTIPAGMQWDGLSIHPNGPER